MLYPRRLLEICPQADRAGVVIARSGATWQSLCHSKGQIASVEGSMENTLSPRLSQ